MTVSRRQAVVVLAATGILGPLSLWLTSRDTATSTPGEAFPIQKSDAEWRAALTPERYRILRGHSTERAFSSPLNAEKRHGTFVCAACGQLLFSSQTKFESGTGWPSFWRPLDNAVGTRIDRSWLMVRTEVHCARCGSHLGHVFGDGPAPTGLRFCMNGLALQFVEADRVRHDDSGA
jgi:peptide-methionine (R)-S-oxide reductase